MHHNAGLDGVGGSSYIDSIIMRDRDANTVWFDEADSTREERTYYLQNWRHDVSIMLTAGGSMIQWIKYSAYGVPFGIPAGDVNSDGQVTQADANLAGTWYLAPHYDVRADLNLDGDFDVADLTILAAARDAGHTIGRGHLSLDETGLRRGYAGYEYDVTFSGAGRNLYHVRHRVYDADLGRWTRRDPLAYVDGMSLYAYVSLMPMIAQDPQGLAIYVDGGGAPITATAAGGSPCGVGGGSMLAASADACGGDDEHQWRYPAIPVRTPQREVVCRRWATQMCDSRGGSNRSPYCRKRCIDAATSCCWSGYGNDAIAQRTCTRYGVREMALCNGEPRKLDRIECWKVCYDEVITSCARSCDQCLAVATDPLGEIEACAIGCLHLLHTTPIKWAPGSRGFLLRKCLIGCGAGLLFWSEYACIKCLACRSYGAVICQERCEWNW